MSVTPYKEQDVYRGDFISKPHNNMNQIPKIVTNGKIYKCPNCQADIAYYGYDISCFMRPWTIKIPCTECNTGEVVLSK